MMPHNLDNEEKLAAAKEDLLEGRIATVAATAREHGVTEKQLRNWLKGIGPLSSRPVNGKNLSDGQEEGLCLYIQKIDDIGFSIIPEAVEANANAILARYHEDPNLEPQVMGKSWARHFLHCYNEKGFNIRI